MTNSATICSFVEAQYRHWTDSLLCTCITCWHAIKTQITSCAGGCHNMPPPPSPWPLTLKVVSESRVTRHTWLGHYCASFSLPRPLCSRLRPDVRDRQTSDVIRASSLNVPTLGAGQRAYVSCCEAPVTLLSASVISAAAADRPDVCEVDLIAWQSQTRWHVRLTRC